MVSKKVPKKVKKTKNVVGLLQTKTLRPFSISDCIIEEKSNVIVKVDVESIFEEKYKPKTIDKIIGNKESTILLKNFIQTKIDNIKSRNFAIIYGPSGIGKNTITELLLKEANYSIVEFNSDNTTQKSVFFDKITRLLTTNSINKMITSSKNTAIVIENLDLTLGEGVYYTKFVELLEKYPPDKIPIICTSGKLKKKYNTPSKILLVQLLCPELNDFDYLAGKILKKEKMVMTKGALKKIIESSRFDIRQFLRKMRMCCLSTTIKKFDKDNIDTILNFSETDNFFGAYEVMDQFLKPKRDISVEESCIMCLADQPLIIDLLYSNVPHILKMPEVSKCLDSLSTTDEIQKLIFKNHLWELRNYLICGSCVNIKNIIQNNVKIKKSYIIKKNQLNNLPWTCIKNNNTLIEIKSSYVGCCKLDSSDLRYAFKYILKPTIEKESLENDKDVNLQDDEQIYKNIPNMLRYGLTFLNYCKMRSIQFEKVAIFKKKTKNKLEKMWNEILEKIQLCKMYIRSNKEINKTKLKEKLSLQKSEWKVVDEQIEYAFDEDKYYSDINLGEIWENVENKISFNLDKDDFWENAARHCGNGQIM
jgi:hypothetical protein